MDYANLQLKFELTAMKLELCDLPTETNETKLIYAVAVSDDEERITVYVTRNRDVMLRRVREAADKYQQYKVYRHTEPIHERG